MRDFIITCESTADLPYDYLTSRGAKVLFYKYFTGETAYEDNMMRDKSATEKYYREIKSGIIPTTSRLNDYDYETFFKNILDGFDGDILHIAFSSGMSGSVESAFTARKSLSTAYPDRKITVIDSLCASSGYGLLVDLALDLKDEGKDYDYVATAVEREKLNIHHEFFSTTLDFFRRTGRVCFLKAKIAGILGICPIMRVNAEGKIIMYDNARGKRRVAKKIVDEMFNNAFGGENYCGKCFISHSNCLEDAVTVKSEVLARFKNLIDDDVKIFDIGAVISAHCGPGTVALYYSGAPRK